MIIKKIAIRNQINIVIKCLSYKKWHTVPDIKSGESWIKSMNLEHYSGSQHQPRGMLVRNKHPQQGRGCYDSQELFHHGLTPYTIHTCGGGRGRSQGQQFETVLPCGSFMTQKPFFKKPKRIFLVEDYPPFYQLIIKLIKLISKEFILILICLLSYS